MKYSYIALGMCIFFGCQSVVPPSPPPRFEKEFEVRSLDLKKYASENFLISQGPYGSDHVTLAYIMVKGSNGAKPHVSKIIKSASDSRFADPEEVIEYDWLQDEVSVEEVVEAAVKAAKEIGADGLVGVRWHSNRNRLDPPLGAQWPTLFRDEISFEGWAINREIK